MKKIWSAVVVTAFWATSLAAHAADLPSRPAYAPVTAVPIYNWTGIYFGMNAGYGWGQQDPLNIVSNRFDNNSIGMSGGLFGGTIGAQIQSGHVVLGLEADIDWANIKGASAFFTPSVAGVALGGVNATTNIGWVSTARARVGYANQNWLLYATGGLAILGAKTDLTTVAGQPVCGGVLRNCAGTSRQVGGVIGTGLEYGFTPNWSAKVEYLYVTAVSLDVSHHSEVRVGVNYRMGGN